jgi:hypothetical protein
MNPPLEESVVSSGIVILGKLEKLPHMLKVERRFRIAQVSKHFGDLGVYVCG